jgi:hypothetical protein
LEIIEYEDNLKLYASVWEVNDDGEVVLTKNGMVVISKEPSLTLLRLLGNSLNSTIFLWIQHGTSRSLADAQKLVHRQVMTKLNEDRPYFEARGAWKKVKGDFDYDGPQTLANLSLIWETMVGKRQGIILKCNGRLLHEIVKGVVTCVKAKPVKNCPAETKKYKKCGIESCNSFIHAICKSKKFCFKHANPENKKRCIKCSKNYAQILGVSAEVVLEANRKQSDYESPNNPFEEDEVNGHEGVDINRILHDEEIDDAKVFDD